jgi:hypothetical protein
MMTIQGKLRDFFNCICNMRHYQKAFAQKPTTTIGRAMRHAEHEVDRYIDDQLFLENLDYEVPEMIAKAMRQNIEEEAE